MLCPLSCSRTSYHLTFKIRRSPSFPRPVPVAGFVPIAGRESENFQKGGVVAPLPPFFFCLAEVISASTYFEVPVTG